jgi:hypothetical protein
MSSHSRLAVAPAGMIGSRRSRFGSHADTQAVLDALCHACLEWTPRSVADTLRVVLLEGQEPEAPLTPTAHRWIARIIGHYLKYGDPQDALPEWLTRRVIERTSQRLRSQMH